MVVADRVFCEKSAPPTVGKLRKGYGEFFASTYAFVLIRIFAVAKLKIVYSSTAFFLTYY